MDYLAQYGAVIVWVLICVMMFFMIRRFTGRQKVTQGITQEIMDQSARINSQALEVNKRSLANIERSELILDRQEKLMDRLEKIVADKEANS